MMRLPSFRYIRPKSVEDALRVAAQEPDAVYVGGGTDLYPNMKRRQETPKTVISLGGIQALRGISGDANEGVRIGAMTTITEIASSSLLQASFPWVKKAASLISTPLLRNMGTIGGNLLLDTRCNYYDQSYEWRKSIDFCMKKDGDTCWVAPSSPRCWAVQSSDLVPLLCAIGARVRLRSIDQERDISATDLYQDDGIRYLKKKRSELLTEIILPPRNGARAAYFKVRRRGSFDFPVLGVGACLSFDGDTVTHAKIALGGVGSHPVPCPDAEKLLVGGNLSEERIRAAADSAAKPARPLDNTDYHMSWRKRVVPTFVARTLRAIRDQIPGGSADSFDGVGPTGSVLPMSGG